MTALPTSFWGRPGTTMNGGGRPTVRVQEGEYTKVIYTLITEKKFDEAKQILQTQLEFFSDSRAALSLLAYCDYMLQNFSESAQTYEKLVRFNPTVDQYKFYQAQSLYKAGMYPEAIKACSTIESEELFQKVSGWLVPYFLSVTGSKTIGCLSVRTGRSCYNQDTLREVYPR